MNGYPGTKWLRADRLSEELAPEFEKTIKFEYRNGKVDQIKVPANSSLFVHNIKKAMVNTLQLTLKSDQDIYFLQEVQSNRSCPCLQANGAATVFLTELCFHTRWVHRELARPLTCWTGLCPTKGSE